MLSSAQDTQRKPLVRDRGPDLRMTHLRRSNRYTWAPNGWNNTVCSEGSGLWGTQFLTLCCPDDFHAVRIGFPNITRFPCTIPSVRVVASATMNDMCNPTGGAAPVQLTFANAGRDVDRIVTAAAAPTTVVVGPNVTDASSGEAAIPAWTWTDWVPCSSVSADPETGMRVLMIRHTVDRNEGNPVTFTNGRFLGWSGVAAIHRGYDLFYGGINNGTDHTLFGPVPRDLAFVNAVTNGPMAGCVQFLTAHTGVVGMTTGDSHHIGTGTTASLYNYLSQAILALGRRHVGRIPFGLANCSQGGADSQRFFPCLQTLLPSVRPGFVVLPGWTYNEMNGAEHADATACRRFLARLLMVADTVRASGAVPIFLTPFPRDAEAMRPDRLAAWQMLRRTILDLRTQGDIVVDAGAVLGNHAGCELDGTYVAALTTDGIHPNDAGHAAVAALLVPVIEDLAGIG